MLESVAERFMMSHILFLSLYLKMILQWMYTGRQLLTATAQINTH